MTGVPLRWYLLALVGVPLVAVAVAVALLGLPASDVTASLPAALVLGLLLQKVFTFLPNNRWEEVAWMGFFQARLQDRHHSALRAALLTAPLFAMQHIALAVSAGAIGAVMMLVLVVIVIPFRMLRGPGSVSTATGSPRRCCEKTSGGGCTRWEGLTSMPRRPGSR